MPRRHDGRRPRREGMHRRRLIEEIPQLVVRRVRRDIPHPHDPLRAVCGRVGMVRLA